MPDIDFDKWEEFKKLLKKRRNDGPFLTIEIFEMMYEIEGQEEALIKKYWEDYEKSKVVIHCSKCGCRMELIPSKERTEEIECPLMGCGQMTGMKGYFMICAGGRD